MRVQGSGFRVQGLGVDVGGAVSGVVVLFPALLVVAVRLIETDGWSVFRIYMEPDAEGSGLLRGVFEAGEEFAGDAKAAVLGRDFEGLDIGVAVGGGTGR